MTIPTGSRPNLKRSLIRALALAISSYSVVTSTIAFACPQALQNAHSDSVTSFHGDLCALADSTALLKKSLLSQGIVAEKMIGLRAGRFINFPDWQAANAKGIYDPRVVYDPSPSTWDSWAQAADQVDHAAMKNAQLNQLPDFAIADLQRINKLALPPTENSQGGVIRSWGQEESGKAITRAEGLTHDQVDALTALEYHNPQNQTIVSWEPTICLEDAPADIQQKFSGFRDGPGPSELEHPGAWYDYKGQQRHCGLFHYCAASLVSSQLKSYIANVNSYLALLRSGAGRVDPIWLAARVERWLVAIHPFTASGNGRTSRFAADTLIETLGLPAPVLQTDMNVDIETSEARWASVIGQGIDAAYNVLLSCSRNSAAPICRSTN